MSLKRRNNFVTKIKSRKGGIYIPTSRHNQAEVVRPAEVVKNLPPAISESEDAVKQAEADMKKMKRGPYKKRKTLSKAKPKKKAGVKKATMKTKKASGKKTTRRRKITAKANIFDLIKAVKTHKK